MDSSTQEVFTPTPPPLSDQMQDDPQVISWTASEYMQHHRNPSWYVLVLLSILALGATGYVLTEDLITPISIAVLGALLIVVAAKKPRTLTYEISGHGIVVGTRNYAYQEFQSFSVADEGQFESIRLMPQRRWAPEISLYFLPQDGQKIFDILSTYLPLETHRSDPMESFLRKIKF